jgi:hypothetical protein
MKDISYVINDIALSVDSPVTEAFMIAKERLRRVRVSLRDV